jgi:two-component system, NtrC family, response regulator AtoC
VKGLSADAKTILLTYEWPGNIRELRNVIERAVLIESNEYIETADLAIKTQAGSNVVSEAQASAELAPDLSAVEIKVPNHGVNFEDVEKQLIRIAMRHCNNNASAAARFLRMTRETLRYRLKKFGIREYTEE